MQNVHEEQGKNFHLLIRLLSVCTHALERQRNFNSQAGVKKATGICFSAFINKIMFEVTMKMENCHDHRRDENR
jgi:hypothetical protein